MILRCVLCGSEYRPGEARYACPACGPDGVLRFVYERAEVVDPVAASGGGMWRYRPLLPLGGAAPDLPVGGTPLLPGGRLGAALGLPRLWVKDETRNPTGSLKDRASALVAWVGCGEGASAIACASTGNAAGSLAAATAQLGMPCYLFVPRTAPAGKLAQMATFGATVFAVDGSYDQSFDLCLAACERFGWFNRNTGYNPYTVEGKKTAGLEVWEQLGRRVPDAILVPTGDGCILGGIGKAFRDLRDLGFSGSLPRLIGVQAEGCQPLRQAWLAGARLPEGEVAPQTIADGIAVGRPRNAAMALQDVRDSGGAFLAVSDEEMLQAVQLLGRHLGVFAEAAAAASVAGAIRARDEGLVGPGETVVALVTGTGLKDAARSASRAPQPVPVPPDLEALAALLGGVGPA